MRVIGRAAAFGALAIDVLATVSSAVGFPTVGASSVDVKAAEKYRHHHHQLPADAATAAASGTADRRHFAARALDAAKQGSDGGASTQHQHGRASSPSAAAAQPSRTAYATLLYSDFIEGTRALGQSLRESGTSADTVVLVTPDVQQETRQKLAEDGWIVRPVAVETNPNQNFQSRLVFVYTKLLIVEMEEEYDRIVFLDADTLVLENIDELFECEPFCAVMRHSELLNSGVLVITPSKELYGHMHDLIGELDSYTGGDQGFLNSFYPYFAACPAFEPYPILGSRLAGVGSGMEEINGGGGGGGRRVLGGDRDLDSVLVEGRGVEDKSGGERQAVAMEREGGTRRRRLAGEGAEWVRPKGWGCKRLPTRYNGDWPLLFVDGDLQVVQGKEAGPEAPADWKRRKKVKILHFTFGTAKPWNWWTYPFLPYVDLWLEAFHRLDGRKAGSPGLGAGGEKANRGAGRTGRGRGRRPRWNGVVGQAVHGLAPLFVVAVLWRAAKRWTATRRALRSMCIALARYTIPVKALNARSLTGSVFNLTTGLVLALSGAVLAFRAVPTTRLGAARPEAAWAFFWGRATALVIIAEGSYLVLVSLKAHKVFAASTPRDNALELDPTGNGDGGCTATPMVAPPAGACPGRRATGTGTVPQPSGGQASVTTAGGGIIVGSGVAEGTGRQGGASVGGPCGPRRLALTETVAHLLFLSAMATSLVSAPLWVGLNGFPASREVVPGVARLLALLVAFTFSAVRLPPLWAAHARSFDSSGSKNTSTKGSSSRGSSGSSGGGGVGAGCGSWKRGRRMSRSNRLEMQAERAALNNLSPLSDHHTA
ncbi:unnamed protein product [Ectocarpus sp. 12 AP-2014]